MRGEVVPIRVTKSNDHLDQEYSDHESFGMVGLSAYTTSGDYHFGSKIPHSSGVTLTIMRGREVRNLNREWYSGDGKPLIEVKLTSAQFAQMLTTMNHGDGVPCTLLTVAGKQMPTFPPPKSLREVSKMEVDEHMTDLSAKMKKAFNTLNQMMTGELSMTKANLKAALQEVSAADADLGTNADFMAKSVVQRIDKQLTEAQANFDGYMSSKLKGLGIEALANQLEAGMKGSSVLNLTEGKHED